MILKPGEATFTKSFTYENYKKVKIKEEETWKNSEESLEKSCLLCFVCRCSINDADLCAHHTNTSSFVHTKVYDASIFKDQFGSKSV